MRFWKQGGASSGRSQGPLAEGLKAAGDADAFPGLPDADLVRLFNTATLVKLAPGDLLFGPEDRADRLHILTAGRLQLRYGSEGAGEWFGPGDWICDVDFEDDSTQDATAIAVVPTTVLVIDAPTFAASDPALKDYLTERMRRLNLDRLRRLERQKSQFASLNAGLIDALYAVGSQCGVGFAQTEAARQLFAKVPALPVSTLTLLNKMLDDRTTKAEIVELVSMDPSLTSTLLKAANSPFYGFLYKVTNVSHAIVLLGHNSVYQIIMSEGMRRSLPSTPYFAEIHRRAIEISRLAFVLSQTVNVAKPAEIATIGILSDIGLVVTELLKTSNPRLSRLFDFIAAAEMGSELLRSWNLPETLCDSLQYQHYPEFTPPERIPAAIRSNVALLYLARRFYHRLHQTDELPPGLFLEAYLDTLGQSGRSEDDLLHGRIVPRLRTQLRSLPRSLVDALQSSDEDE